MEPGHCRAYYVKYASHIFIKLLRVNKSIATQKAMCDVYHTCP